MFQSTLTHYYFSCSQGLSQWQMTATKPEVCPYKLQDVSTGILTTHCITGGDKTWMDSGTYYDIHKPQDTRRAWFKF